MTPGESGVASDPLDTSRQLGGALGLAVVGSVVVRSGSEVAMPVTAAISLADAGLALGVGRGESVAPA